MKKENKAIFADIMYTVISIICFTVTLLVSQSARSYDVGKFNTALHIYKVYFIVLSIIFIVLLLLLSFVLFLLQNYKGLYPGFIASIGIPAFESITFIVYIIEK